MNHLSPPLVFSLLTPNFRKLNIQYKNLSYLVNFARIMQIYAQLKKNHLQFIEYLYMGELKDRTTLSQAWGRGVEKRTKQ